MPSNNSEQLRFDGRVVIITGAGQGMGREHALLLGSLGAIVVVNDLVKESVEDTAKEVREAGGTATAVSGSIADRATAECLVTTAIEEYGRIDILINNAGIEIKKSFADFTDSDLSRMIGVHVWGSWMLTQLVWPHMQKQEYGRVLIVCSTSLFGMPSNAAYVAAKGALFGLGRSLAIEGPEHGILVNCFGPSANTAMARQMASNDGILEFLKEMLPASATSQVVAWLVHEDCKANGEFITSYGRSVGRILLAETKGCFCPEGSFTPETVRDHFVEACDPKDFIIPTSVEEEGTTLFKMRLTSPEHTEGFNSIFRFSG
ncbi:hypothetical protein FDECE_15262 [Fusarium decemcellulare]|nr:hypothetical protein FDECE_15262 [Fusarium decemcellulare]